MTTWLGKNTPNEIRNAGTTTFGNDGDRVVNVKMLRLVLEDLRDSYRDNALDRNVAVGLLVGAINDTLAKLPNDKTCDDDRQSQTCPKCGESWSAHYFHAVGVSMYDMCPSCMGPDFNSMIAARVAQEWAKLQ